MKFCVANGEMAQYVHRIMPNYVIVQDIGSTAVELSNPLGTTVDSLLQEGFGLSSSPGLHGRGAGWDVILPEV